MEAHYQKLERMYLAAPINELHSPTIDISEGQAIIESEVDPCFFHTAGALHGSVYFKALDDAAFFAAASLEPERFVLTVSFTIYLTRPVTGGRLRAEGRVATRTSSLLVAESVTHPLPYYRNNVASAATLIDAALHHGVRAFVLSSTAAVYGHPEHQPISEAAPLAPINPYAASKAMVERILVDV